MDTRVKTEKIYSILELNNTVKTIINKEFPNMIWVHGEIQDYNKNKHKPNIFFKLCEKHPEIDRIIAQVTVVIFERSKAKLAQILKQAENKFDLQDDIEVKLLCKVDLYSQSGNFMLIVESIDPIYTLGKLAQNRQKIIVDLRTKGILDKNRKLTIPIVPLNVGLVTSYDSAAYHDFVAELMKSNYGFKIHFFDSSMQGKNVEQDVCRALEIFDRYNFLDVVVITRGGGSTADLSWFDNAKIAERIAISRLPILSGIGHEINVTITDMAAHTFMKTPTAIAQFLVHNIKDFLSGIEDKEREITNTASSRIQGSTQELRLLSMNTCQSTINFLRIHRENIVNKSSILKLSTSNFVGRVKIEISNKNQELSLRIKQLLRNFRKYLEFSKEKIAPKKLHNVLVRLKAEIGKKEQLIIGLSNNIIRFCSGSLRDKQRQVKSISLSLLRAAERSIKNYENTVKIADPLNTVKRGFSITKTKNGLTVRSINDVEIKDDLITIVSDGRIQSEIKRKE